MQTKTFPTDEIDFWVFDLDNTLYPPGDELFSQVDFKITEYVSTLLNMDKVAARSLQKDLYRDYGTTLHGLMKLYHIDPEDYLAKVHDIDYSWLKPDLRLRNNLQQLKGKKYIFTNGDQNHAIKVLHQLEIDGLFDGIFDIKAANYIPKPQREAYDLFVKHFSINPSRAVMFEDLIRNLAVPKAMTMQTVLITPTAQQAKNHDTPLGYDNNHDHIDFVTTSLNTFLAAIINEDQDHFI